MRLARDLVLWAVLASAFSSCGGTPTPTPTPTPVPTPEPCTGTAGAFATGVVSSWIPRCSLAQNEYNTPSEALGAPNAAGFGPVYYSGFVSLGFGGYVTFDFGGCIVDRPGNDIRVYQAVSKEPVTVYVSNSAQGPFTLIEPRKPCGERVNRVQGYCDFDLAAAGLTNARYVRVEDGELYPCPGGTQTEGADLDAVGILAAATAAEGTSAE
jgi:hypothetical protein